MAIYALMILILQTIIIGAAITDKGNDEVLSRFIVSILWIALQLPIFLRAMGFI